MITVNTEEVERDIKWFMRKEYPWALKKTLDAMAKEGQKAVQIQTRKEFSLHTDFVPKGVWAQVAKKKDIIAKGEGQSAVFTAPRISGFMPIHETGGTRTPQQSRNIAIPAQDLKQLNFRTSTGKVKKQYKPKTLLEAFNRGTSSSGSRTKDAFLIRGKGGTPLIVRRKTKARYPLKVLYNLSRSASYKERWDFEDTVRQVVRRDFAKVFAREMENALR